MILTIALLIFFKVHVIICNDNETLVETQSGTIKGNQFTINETTINEYLGIPYAQPPIGNKRFQKPEAFVVSTSSPPIEAKTFKNSCIQGLVDMGYESKYFNITKLNVSEDCLYLNIWVPNNTNSSSSNKSVLVFIHGGGLRYGSSSLDLYNGSMLAAKTGLIVVTMNYRLGMFGFAYMDYGTNLTGNMGLLDQQMALKWVHDNIANFSGDPNSVTLWGQGAGAVCASAHLFSKNSENYFKKLILMSGSINGLLDVYENSAISTSTRIAAQRMGCFKQSEQANHTYIFSCLLNQSIDNITKYSDNVTYQINMPSTLGFNIILNDTVFFNGTLEEKIQTGNMKYYVDVLFGMPNNSGSFFLPILKNATHFGCKDITPFNYDNDTCKLSKDNYTSFWGLMKNPLKLGNNFEIVKSIYNLSMEEKYRQDAVNVLTDVSYRCHMVEFARKVNIKTHGYIYGYYFNTSSSNNNWPQWMVSTHGDELDYAFGLPFRYPGNYTQRLEQEKILSENVMNMIKNFTVSEGSSLRWMDFVDKSRKGISINADFYQDRRISLIDDMETDECRKILQYLPKYLSPN